MVRPDVYFTPYFPAVFFATAFGGFRIGIATAFVGALFGVAPPVADAPSGRNGRGGANRKPWPNRTS